VTAFFLEKIIQNQGQYLNENISTSTWRAMTRNGPLLICQVNDRSTGLRFEKGHKKGGRTSENKKPYYY